MKGAGEAVGAEGDRRTDHDPRGPTDVAAKTCVEGGPVRGCRSSALGPGRRLPVNRDRVGPVERSRRAGPRAAVRASRSPDELRPLHPAVPLRRRADAEDVSHLVRRDRIEVEFVPVESARGRADSASSPWCRRRCFHPRARTRTSRARRWSLPHARAGRVDSRRIRRRPPRCPASPAPA